MSSPGILLYLNSCNDVILANNATSVTNALCFYANGKTGMEHYFQLYEIICSKPRISKYFYHFVMLIMAYSSLCF